ncbi:MULTISPECIES: hypothetical protein [Haloarcula]|uniref:Uncharacterized protein n=1 Tax=Haloarcula amylolytica JCM 13557 TaxID=1227452 RepID=M0KIB3_9EURY|nr:hypothetical protein [Haloarcula amylolytica]EMA19545.1 hypothetical protein C442_13550 [Haloarcula amylolytica JCM 13557]
MTRTLLRTVGTLVLALTLFTAAAAAAPAVDGDDGTNAVGPPGGLPDQVPDFVTTIIEAIQEFLAGGSDDSPGSDVSGAATGVGT